ncbi:MAG: AAA family ATPase [Desulfobacterales bacterium]|nr:AAA family ATPase [Desulfobacterales bacterium]
MALTNSADSIKAFYLRHLPQAKFEGQTLHAPCPFCPHSETTVPGKLIVNLDPESFFYGHFRCLARCIPGGFTPHFGRLLGIDPNHVPGCDPDRISYVRNLVFPSKTLNAEVRKHQLTHQTGEPIDFFLSFGISAGTLNEMRIGYNGRYLVYPYFQENGNCYAYHCIRPGNDADAFWAGEEKFQEKEFQIFNIEDIERCENGAIFITEGEKNLLVLKELGYPGIAVPSLSVLDALPPERFADINHVFILFHNSAEAQIAARSLATSLGFKARILNWPPNKNHGYDLTQLARETQDALGAAVARMIKRSKAFSPFTSPEREHRRFLEALEKNRGKSLLGMPTGFEKMDHAMDGISGINIMGGQPKAGKSTFFMQISTEAARRGMSVIYYDFENSRQKIYLRTLCRLSRLSEESLRRENPDPEAAAQLQQANEEIKKMLTFFRVVTDRKLSPDIMRRQIDFMKHETRTESCMVVVDSLHKLPFKNFSERRTGIDEWLRHMEAIRDEQQASFLVVSELSRGREGNYSKQPDLGSFKESGDIEYSADNAIILQPNWDLLDPQSTAQRVSTLWLVASREKSPGKIADYALDYPYWGFKEL